MGLSDYYFNEIAVEAARPEASGPNKRATLSEYLLKKREHNMITALSLTEQGQKASRRRKIPLVRKSYSLYLRVKLHKGVYEVGEDDDE